MALLVCWLCVAAGIVVVGKLCNSRALIGVGAIMLMLVATVDNIA